MRGGKGMLLFMSAAGLILAYGAAYALFCIKKGGVSAALTLCCLLLADLVLLVLLLYYRINT